MTAVLASHIVLDENGVAWIDDTNVKVIELVLDKLAHGSSAEERARRTSASTPSACQNIGLLARCTGDALISACRWLVC